MIKAERSHLLVSAGTHPGMRGKNNEDQYSVAAFQLNEKNDAPVVFAILADGIGGHMAGEVAAEIAVNVISEAVAESDGSKPLEVMESSIMEASRAIFAQSNSTSEKKGMGTTCVCVWVIGERLFTASVGDSRIYLLRKNKISQLNIDHTWVQEGVDAGALTLEQARDHPNANIIRRYLGSSKSFEVDFRLRTHPEEKDANAVKNQGTRLQTGDRLLLCSDGLSDMIEDADILKLFKSPKLDDAVPALIDLANENGGKDNITLITLEVPDSKGDSVWQRKTKSNWLYVGIGGALLLGLALMAYFGWNFLQGSPTLTPTATDFPNPSPSVPVGTELEFDFQPITTEFPQATSTALPLGSPSATYTAWPTDTPSAPDSTSTETP
ncbi:MAG: serine/threonine-protein phosphatase [Chloroflexi bacterium]|nr:serine/threonine-protein phosphatase [Chloroflexota bacterium]